MVKVSKLHKHILWNWSAINLVIFSILLLMASASASTETDQLLHPRLPTARSLLQAQQACTVNFENLNYTIITSKCKGPRYPANVCCEAFKELACPYASELNSQTNNCATTMFSYIDLNGHYPPGLFANECRDSKRGLECTEAQSSTEAPPSSVASPLFAPSIFLVVLLLCQLFIA